MPFLWGKKNKDAALALIDAAWDGHAAIVRSLLTKGVDVNARDELGWTALMTAAYHKHKKVAVVLISNGADVNAKNKYGSTALVLASIRDDTDIVNLLRQAGAKE